jgi:hypothetical protein
MNVGWKTRHAPGKIAQMILLFMVVSVLGLATSGLQLGQQNSDQSKDPQKSDKSPSEQTDQSKQAPKEPIDRADELKSKLTLGIYFLSNARVYDINLRHRFGNVTAWIAGFYDPKGTKLARVGAQYDYKYKWIHVVPTTKELVDNLHGGEYSAASKK